MLAETEYAVPLVTNGAGPVVLPVRAAASAPLAAPEPPEPEAPIHHHQSQAQLALLRRARELLSGLAGADDAFRQLMPAYGLTPAFLAEGASRCDAADEAIAARRLAMVAALEATERQAEAQRAARTAYGAFRRVARTVVRSAPGKMALGLDEAPPTNLADFVQSATAMLAVAQGEPYASVLTAATFGPARVTETQATLQALAAVMTAQRSAQTAAKRATEDRDAAVATVRTFVQQATVEIETMLRQHPELRAPAGC
ncbi:MAG TPA: hypothetical protein DCL15_02620 [Chloroflexi bacterium]|nr:hypothetical protein [Chloroflexota bacterium]HHW86589.1 hypothetical protein [Chloroflexota bacterium]